MTPPTRSTLTRGTWTDPVSTLTRAAERLAEDVWLAEHGCSREELLAIVLAERFGPADGVKPDTRITRWAA